MKELYYTMIESQIYFNLSVVLCFAIFFISIVLITMLFVIEIKHKKIGAIVIILLSILVLFGSQPLIRQLAKNEANKIIEKVEKYNNTEK